MSTFVTLSCYLVCLTANKGLDIPFSFRLLSWDPLNEAILPRRDDTQERYHLEDPTDYP